MKRSPMKRTPMKRAQKPMRKRSVKMEGFYRDKRRPMVARVLAEAGLRCEFVKSGSRCRNVAVDVHEMLTRGRGGGILADAVNARENLMAVCRRHHEWITEHPVEAEALGYVKHNHPGSV